MSSDTSIRSALLAPSTGALVAGGANSGALIVNADDWGQDTLTTDRILQSCLQGAVTSVSAMVFMADSERAAELAGARKIETGLHLNFTTRFSADSVSSRLLDHQQRLAAFLLRHRLAQAVFHPGLANSFRYVAAAQLEEFRRIYGADPDRIDGHHHMHLCVNVLAQRLLPAGTMVRRSFSFAGGEKSAWNRMYRGLVDKRLARRHRLTDYFFSLPPMEPASRLERIYSLARQFVVELETHPARTEELSYLSGRIFNDTRDVRIAPPSAVLRRESGPPPTN